MLSLSHLSVLDASPPELVGVAAVAGFDAVGVRVWPAGSEPAYPMLDPGAPMLRDTLGRLADTGVQVLDVEVLRLLPDTTLAHCERILDAGAELGARGVLVIANDPDESHLIANYAAVCAGAGERGLRACLEFMVFSSVRTLADAVRVVAAADHPAAAILVDALHLQRAGGTPADVAALPRDLLPYAQLCDGPAGPILPPDDVALTEARTGRLNPGDGEFPLRELVAALPDNAPLAVEAPVAALAGRPAQDRAKAAFDAIRRVLD